MSASPPETARTVRQIQRLHVDGLALVQPGRERDVPRPTPTTGLDGVLGHAQLLLLVDCAMTGRGGASASNGVIEIPESLDSRQAPPTSAEGTDHLEQYVGASAERPQMHPLGGFDVARTRGRTYVRSRR